MLMAGTRWLALSCAGVRWRAPSCGVGHSPCPGVRWCEVLRRCCYGAVQWLRDSHLEGCHDESEVLFSGHTRAWKKMREHATVGACGAGHGPAPCLDFTVGGCADPGEGIRVRHSA